MDQTSQPVLPSKGKIWAGRILSALVILFMLFDSVLKFFKPMPVLDAFAKLGLPMTLCIPIATIALVCTLLYAIPQTSILGAILLTGYLGGAVVTHLRVGDPLFSHILFPTYVGLLMWLGLYFRESRLRVLIPWRG